jgi:hypothetical protein
VDIPTIVSMRTIAVFVNIVRLLSFFIKEACASLLLSWTILLAVFLHKQGLSVISECKITTFCVRTQFFSPIFFVHFKFLDFPQKHAVEMLKSLFFNHNSYFFSTFADTSYKYVI